LAVEWPFFFGQHFAFGPAAIATTKSEEQRKAKSQTINC